MSWKQSRRRFLKGAGAATLALPTLEIFGTPARAADKLPRLVVYYLPNGRRPEWWVPTGNDGSLVFPEPASALQPYANRALVVTALDNSAARRSPAAAHAMGTGTVMTCTAIPNQQKITNNVSLDQLVVQRTSPDTRYKSLQWSAGEPGTCDVGASSCAYTQSISWAGPGQPLTPTIDPAAAFDRLFGSTTDGLTGAAGDTRKRSLVSVLDAVRDDAASLSQDLGAADRERLDEYFTSLRELEKGLTTGGGECAVPAAGQASGLSYADRVTAFHNLMRLAFECDQTRVLSFMIEFGLSGRSHDFIGAPGGHHALSHYQGPDASNRLRAVETWQAQQLGAFLSVMDSVPGGSLLNDTVVLVMPSMGEGNGHDHENCVPMLFGGETHMQTVGKRINGGGTDLANFHHTLLQAFGINEKFGDLGDTTIAGMLR